MKVAFEEKLWKLGRGFGGCLSSWVLSILRPILNEISCLYFCSWHIGKTLWFWILYIKFSRQYYIKVNQNFYTIYFKNQNTFTHFKYLCIDSSFLSIIFILKTLYGKLFFKVIELDKLQLILFVFYVRSHRRPYFRKPVQLVMTGLKKCTLLQ
jgi:hypothetical protein